MKALHCLENYKPRVKKVHDNHIFIGAAMQKTQVPANYDAIEAAKDTLHQPRENEMQFLDRIRQNIKWTHSVTASNVEH